MITMIINRLKETINYNKSMFIIACTITLFQLYSLHDCFIDDAYIVLSYAKNFLPNIHWGLTKYEFSNTATSPLNVVLLAIIGYPFNDYELAAVIVAFLSIIFIFHLMGEIAVFYGLKRYFVFPFFSLFLFNPFILSTIGLETIPLLSFILFSIFLYLQKRFLILGSLLGILYLFRPDTLLFSISILIYIYYCTVVKLKELTFKTFFKKLFLPFSIVLFIAVIVEWWLLGSLFPLTFFLKFNQKWPDDVSYLGGLLLYLKKLRIETLISFIPLMGYFIYIILSRIKYSPILKYILIISLLTYACYSLLNVPPYHWYYVPIIFMAILFVFFFFITAIKAEKIILNKSLFIVLTLLPLVLYMYFPVIEKSFILNEAPIHTNWAKKIDYEKISKELNVIFENDVTISVNGEIGTINYFSKIHLDNVFGNQKFGQEIKDKMKEHNFLYEILGVINFYWYPSTKLSSQGSCLFISSTKPLALERFSRYWYFKTKWRESFHYLIN
ncbi:MAG: hypothetical protein V1720_09835 [bacterium]